MKSLEKNDKAPEFTVLDTDDRSISLHDYKGKFLLLSFYRYASCPFCNLRVDESIRYQASRDIKLLAVFQSPKEKVALYVGRQSLNFPILPDPQKNLYKLYGLKSSWFGLIKAMLTHIPRIIKSIIIKGFYPGSMENGASQLPADFLIGPKGEIVIAFYGKDISEHLSFEKIDEAISRYNMT